MKEATAIQIQGLTKSYGSVQALRGVNLEVPRGEIFGFLGPNGAGKTTTIRCLLDLIRPQGGALRVLGFDPQADPVAVRARVGYLPGELSLESNLKVEGVLRYFADKRGRAVESKVILRSFWPSSEAMRAAWPGRRAFWGCTVFPCCPSSLVSSP